MGETDLPEQVFPAHCLYSLTEVLNDLFFPESIDL
ncbi:hypothetical protein B9G53_10615 [Pseudanabaena sp. SR411]|nr:hypothetical protein B9G53_10615 [Pseudanabaena sp. SR411]